MMTYFTLLAQLMACGDYYVLSSAIDLLNGLRGLEDDAWAVTIKLWAMGAEMEVTTN